MSNNFPKGAENALAAIFSVSGPELSPDEKSFFRDASPFGFILFGMRDNIKNPAQLKKLIADLKETLGRECPILIDQEGGRVQRLRPPNWRAYPPMKTFGDMDQGEEEGAEDALRFAMLQLAEELRVEGFNVDCAPVLDALSPETHDAIGDRAFSSDPERIAKLGRIVCETFLESGITPVIKHMPGQGRAAVDSHRDLPVVSASRQELEEIDFKPFKNLAKSNLASALWGMTGHIIYKHIDPERPATVSPEIIQNIIRGHIGFDGLLLSDDLHMGAMKIWGDPASRCALALEAGCDIALYCHGTLEEMRKIANSVPKLTPGALKRLQKAAEFRKLTA